jgi:hypothetical protein
VLYSRRNHLPFARACATVSNSTLSRNSSRNRLWNDETSRSSPTGRGERPTLTRSVSEGCRKSLAARRQRPRSRFGLVCGTTLLADLDRRVLGFLVVCSEKSPKLPRQIGSLTKNGLEFPWVTEACPWSGINSSPFAALFDCTISFCDCQPQPDAEMVPTRKRQRCLHVPTVASVSLAEDNRGK